MFEIEKKDKLWHAACLPALGQAPTPDLHTATKEWPKDTTITSTKNKNKLTPAQR